MSAPTRAGQLVTDRRDGTLGITTDAPAMRTPTIAVQFIDSPYPVRVQLSDVHLFEETAR